MHILLFLAFLATTALSQQTCATWAIANAQCFTSLNIDFTNFDPMKLTADQAWGLCQCIANAPADCPLDTVRTICGAGEDCVKSTVNAIPSWESCSSKYTGTTGHYLAKCACFEELDLPSCPAYGFYSVDQACTQLYNAVDSSLDGLSGAIASYLGVLSSDLQAAIQKKAGSDSGRQLQIIDGGSQGIEKIAVYVGQACDKINSLIQEDCDSHQWCESLGITCPNIQKTAKRSDTYLVDLSYQGNSSVFVVSLVSLLLCLLVALF